MSFAILPLGIITLVLTPISSTLGVVCIKLASFFTGIALSIIQFLGSSPYSSFFVTTPSRVDLVCYYALIGVAIAALDRWKGEHTERNTKIPLPLILALCVILLGTTAFVHSFSKKHVRGSVTATAIDVAQGSSMFLTFPHGTTMLVDGGGFHTGTFDIGRYVVAPYLWRNGVKHVDIVVLTHPDQDHLHGLLYITQHFDVGEVWTNGERGSGQTYATFARTICDKDIPHRVMSAQSPPIIIDGVTVTILNPQQPVDCNRQSHQRYDVNNRALVMKITLGATSLLLPSDISGNVEQRLVTRGFDLRSTALLVPHHGGYTSSTRTFLDAVHPTIAIISCGHADSLRNLHPEVLRRYRSIHARVLRTDTHGAVTLRMDGKDIVTSCFKGNSCCLSRGTMLSTFVPTGIR